MATITRERRKVQYTTFSQFLQDAEKLAAGDYHTVGNWSYGQILEHLARAMNSSIDGFEFQGPWLIRKVVAPFIKNSLLTKPMKPGYRLPKSADAYLPSSATTTESALEQLGIAIARIGNEKPTAEHPFLGRLTDEEWKALHLRHAELHMSFVVPANE